MAEWRTKNRKRYNKMMIEWRKNNPLFAEQKRIRNIANLYLRNKMIERDGKCLDCGSNERLEMHELTYTKPPKLSNLVTLCRKCHRKRHRKYEYFK